MLKAPAAMPGFLIYTQQVSNETQSEQEKRNYWVFHANIEGTSCIICGIVSILALLNIRLTEKQVQ